MNNKKKAFLIVGAMGAVGTALYFMFRKKPGTVVGSIIGEVQNKISPSSSYTAPTTTNVSSSNTSTKTVTSATFPLKKGSRGDEVKNLQTVLNVLYKDVIGTQLVVDGIFGSKTEAALKAATGKTTISQDEYYNLSKASAAAKNLSGNDVFKDETENSSFFDFITDPLGLFG